MVLKRTRWTFDTCDCIITYEWDDNGNDQEKKVHTLYGVNRICDAHKIVHNTLGATELFNKTREENTRKNKVLKCLIESSNDLGKTETDKAGNIIVVVKPNLDFEYEFTGSPLDVGGRTLEVKFKDVNTGTSVKPAPADEDKAKGEMTKGGVDPTKVVIK